MAKHILEAGTEAAEDEQAARLVLFDCSVMDPEPESAAESFQALADAERICLVEAEGEGYLLHAYVEEKPPESLTAYLQEQVKIESFPVPSGKLYFCGAEFAAPDMQAIEEDGFLGGDSFELPPGVYELTLYKAEYPDDFAENCFRQLATPLQVRLYRAMQKLVPLGCFSILIGFLLGGILGWRFFLTTCLPVMATLILLPMILSKLPAYRTAVELFSTVNQQFPSFVVTLYRNELEGE